MDGKIVRLTDLHQQLISKNKEERLSMVRKGKDSKVPLQPLYSEFVLYMEHRDTSSVEAKSVLNEFAKKNK